ncbi:MAG: heat-inducible transcription repressor HrcA [Ruminococcaceae bacterium]|nr:heat-inducible transcription repressor HrcA [Oscillospiraceae bacterium]MBR3596182.1 heat-inducible transcription repressor HrcA [Clostridia bacterium]
MELSERKELILSAVIERFLTTGEPVGSKFLAGMPNVSVSPATIRNEMALLSDMGYLDQPHTSAGRIPSDKGYRYYIDKLLQNFSPSDGDVFRILSSIDHSEGDTVSVISQICDVLSAVTGLTAVAVTPHSENGVITGTKLIPLSSKSAMVVVSTSAGVTKSRIARLGCEIDYPLMELFYNVTAANFTGVQSSALNSAKLQTAASSLGERSLDIMPLIVTFFEAALEASGADAVVKGHSHILSSVELAQDAVQIIELLRNKNTVTALMEADTDSPVSLKIGSENEFSCLRRAAVIKAVYKVGEDAAGCLGVIGPTKTDYSRVIPLVKYISEVAGSILEQMAQT